MIHDEMCKKELSYFQMSDKLYFALKDYLQRYNLTFSKYCEELKVEEYMMRKIVDRKILMYAPYKLLIKIAKSIDCEGIEIMQDPFEIKRINGIKKRTTF